MDDEDDQLAVADLVDDAIDAHAQPVEVVRSTEFLDVGVQTPRVLAERCECGEDAHRRSLRQGTKLPTGRRAEVEAVFHAALSRRSSKISATISAMLTLGASDSSTSTRRASRAMYSSMASSRALKSSMGTRAAMGWP